MNWKFWKKEKKVLRQPRWNKPIDRQRRELSYNDKRKMLLAAMGEDDGNEVERAEAYFRQKGQMPDFTVTFFCDKCKETKIGSIRGLTNLENNKIIARRLKCACGKFHTVFIVMDQVNMLKHMKFSVPMGDHTLCTNCENCLIHGFGNGRFIFLCATFGCKDMKKILEINNITYPQEVLNKILLGDEDGR